MMKRLFYIDVLRLVAMLAVIILHVSARYIVLYDKLPLSLWFFANFADSVTRFCTPVFIMISGAILLEPERPFNLVLRIVHVLVPLLVWSLVYLAWDARSNFEIEWGTWFLSILKGPAAYHLWFPYMIIGLYLLTPLLRLLVNDKKLMEYLLILWIFFSVILPLFEKFLHFSFGIDLNLYSGYIGYFLAGYYLNRYSDPKPLHRYALIFVTGCCITVFGTYFFMLNADGSLDQFFYGRLSPGSLLMSTSIFLIFKNMQFRTPDRFRNFIIQASSLSYGMYLIHALVLAVISTLVVKFRVLTVLPAVNNPIIDIPVRSILVIFISFLAIFIISKIKYLRFLFLGTAEPANKS